MRSIFWTFRGTVVLWAVLAIVGLFLGGCSQPNGGGTGGGGTGGGGTGGGGTGGGGTIGGGSVGGGTTTTPPTYREMVSLSGGTIIGDNAYKNDDGYTGVFIADRTVTLSPFRIAKYETTYELWYEVRQWALSNGYTFANAGREGHDGATGGVAPTEGAKTPVTYISWRDAIVWCNAYSEKSEKEPVYRNTSDVILRDSTATVETLVDITKWAGKDGYRLPTEAEWEYAARGGGTPSPTGSFAYKWAGTNTESALKEYAWYYDNSYNMGHADYGTHSVGTRTANGAGLKDMSGNVFEWCWDYWYDTIGTTTPITGPASGSSRVVRGGGWFSLASGCAVASRGSISPSDGSSYLGFRVVCGN